MRTSPEREWMSTGAVTKVDFGMDRIPDFDERTGDHLWIVTVVYRVDPKKFADRTATPILDMENLLMIPPPGCYYCEEYYSPWLATRRCKGKGRT